MQYRFQNYLSNNDMLSAVYKTSFASFGERKDYHPHCEIYFCTENRPQSITINGQSITLSSPAVIFSSPFSIHSMFPADENKDSLKRFVIYFSESVFSLFDTSLLPDNVLESFSNCIFPIKPESCTELEEIFKRLISPDISESEKLLTFAILVNTLNRLVSAPERISYGKVSFYIIDVLEYIYKNLHTNISSSTIAEHFHVSRAKLDRDFRHFVGRSVRETLIDCRLSFACELLASTDLSIKETAARCGFESEYYFYDFFKKGMKKTPLTWRRENALKNSK